MAAVSSGWQNRPVYCRRSRWRHVSQYAYRIGWPRVRKKKDYRAKRIFGRYLSSGHLAYMHQGTLFAAPMDPARLQVTGPATPMLEDVHYSETFGEAFISYSDAGLAVYGRGRPERPVLVIQWVDANGRLEPLLPSQETIPRHESRQTVSA